MVYWKVLSFSGKTLHGFVEWSTLPYFSFRVLCVLRKKKKSFMFLLWDLLRKQYVSKVFPNFFSVGSNREILYKTFCVTTCQKDFMRTILCRLLKLEKEMKTLKISRPLWILIAVVDCYPKTFRILTQTKIFDSLCVTYSYSFLHLLTVNVSEWQSRAAIYILKRPELLCIYTPHYFSYFHAFSDLVFSGFFLSL
jgi:hypothetical protein